MPKKFKGESTRVTAAKEKKALHQKEVDAKKQVEKEQKEAESWSVGAKSSAKKEAQKLKKDAQLARKNESAKLLEQEEKELSKHRPLLKLTKKSGEETKAIKKTQRVEQEGIERREIPEFSASNIDDALDLLEINVSSTPTSSANIERHPERRFKAAFRAYEEQEMPKLKKENPGLRYTQLQNILHENFKKSPDNPFNQANVLKYNASRGEEIEFIESAKKNIEERLRV